MHFCVVGTGRCGTTLLWEMLNLHPEVYVFRESHWIPKMYELFGTGRGDATELVDVVLRITHVTGDLVFEGDRRTLETLFPEPEEIGVAAFCERIGSHFARREGKRRWADKTPDYGPYMGMLQRLWPTCRFIHLVRDGVATALSMSGHPGYRWLAAAGETWWISPAFNGYHRAFEPADRPFHEFGSLWCRRLRRIRDEARRLASDTYLEMRFEDLVEQPRTALARLCGFTGLEAPEEWLESASSRVDLDRGVTSRRTAELAAAFAPGAARLEVELGYRA